MQFTAELQLIFHPESSRIFSVMDRRESTVLKLFRVVFVANVLIMRHLTGADSVVVTAAPPHKLMCNESRLQWEVEVCGDDFKRNMDHVDPRFWCNFTHFISEYYLFTLCTETKSEGVECYWPNPLVESYIIRIHKTFFSNCTNKSVEWVDPPDETLTLLILIPVFLTLAMIAVVVWCSKRSDLLA